MDLEEVNLIGPFALRVECTFPEQSPEKKICQQSHQPILSHCCVSNRPIHRRQKNPPPDSLPEA